MLHYVPYGKDSQQSRHQGFFTSTIPVNEFLLPIFTEALSTEKATYPMVSNFVLVTMSLYISFTMMSTTKFPRTNHTYNVFESMFRQLYYYY